MSAKKILCIDDDPFYCDFYTTVFAAKGYEVETAQDLVAGYEKARTADPSLIILDVMMPEKGGFFDGYGLLNGLKSDPKVKDIPVIMISALDQAGDSSHATVTGAAGYLPKQDLTPDALFQEVERLTDGPKA